jgi:arginyl-tRNA synthetase
MKEKIQRQIQETLKKLGIDKEADFSIEHPEDFKNGDYSSNVAMVYAKKIGMNPKELAEKIVTELLAMQDLTIIEKVEVAGPGFINFYLSREFFTKSINEILKQKENWGKNNLLDGKKIMVEYTDPNPFKPFHIGHLMTNAIGESISRIVEFSGAEIIRANYQGDVGLHIAKAIYALIKFGMPDESKTISEQAQYIGECYSKGSNLYDSDENIKKEIDEINKKIYKKSDADPIIWNIYLKGMKITMEAFEEIYKLLGTKFNDDCYFLESMMMHIGEHIVRTNMGSIFEESDGAIVFHADKYDTKLHTRVFITSQGLPTYETKEIGLTITKFKKKNPDLSIVVTATEQAEYMKVVQKAISLIHPDYEKKMKHITHGMMKFASGKMSSRKGNIITGESLINDSINTIKNIMLFRGNPSDNKPVYDFNISSEERENIIKEVSRIVGVSALKYSILKSALGSDIVYDFDKSISFEGDSGPYLQYTAVRANSILEKLKEFNQSANTKNQTPPLEVTNLEKLIYQFPEVVENSYLKLEPHHLATYLTELASDFNSFYGNTKILENGNQYMNYQLELVKAFYQTMKNGLWLLGIETPEKM